MSVVSQYKTRGGTGGHPFEFDKIAQGQFVNKIECWRGRQEIFGLKLTFTDKSTEQIGKLRGTYEGGITIDYKRGELIKFISIWLNEKGTKVAGFRITTNKGQVFFPQMSLINLCTKEYQMSAASGVMLGAAGRHGNDVDALCFVMMRKIKRIVLTNVVYPMGVHEAKTRRHVSVFDLTLENKTTTERNDGMKVVSHVEVAWGSWNVTSIHSLAQDFTVVAPLLSPLTQAETLDMVS